MTATVSAESCVRANAFAIAALLWGEDAGYYVAQGGCAGRLVRVDGSVDFVGGWPRGRRRVIALTSPYLWYTSRATGIVALALFTAVVALGTIVTTRVGGKKVGRFEFNELHRSLSIVAVVFLGDPRRDNGRGHLRADGMAFGRRALCVAL